MKIQTVIKEYQCMGCINGSDLDCFESNEDGGIGCGRHVAGTFVSGMGKILLGLPKGFNRLGENDSLRPIIYQTFGESEWTYDLWNIPVWKYLDKHGHTLVRGIMPRLNRTFVHIFLEDCRNKIVCLEITQQDVDDMD